MSPDAERQDGTHSVVVYSEDPAVRERVRMAVGRRAAPDLGRIEWVEAATGAAVLAVVDKRGVDLCVLDGEAWPTGGLGISRQLKNEISDCPAILVLIGRRDDAWLASWSQADATLMHPIDPVETTKVVARLLRARRGPALESPAASSLPAVREAGAH